MRFIALDIDITYLRLFLWVKIPWGCIKIIFEKREFVFEFPFLHIISL